MSNGGMGAARIFFLDIRTAASVASIHLHGKPSRFTHDHRKAQVAHLSPPHDRSDGNPPPQPQHLMRMGQGRGYPGDSLWKRQHVRSVGAGSLARRKTVGPTERSGPKVKAPTGHRVVGNRRYRTSHALNRLNGNPPHQEAWIPSLHSEARRPHLPRPEGRHLALGERKTGFETRAGLERAGG